METKSDIEDGDERRYRAPALEKGLDVLELLAVSDRHLTVNEIGRILERSHGELFRMIQVLGYRGFIEQVAGTDGYQLTDRLLSLGMHRPLMRSLVEVATPEMRQLAEYCGQSCHLAVRAEGDIVVVARMESSQQLSFSVPIGYRQSIWRTASGAILYAHQPDDVRTRWRSAFSPAPTSGELDQFQQRVDRIAQDGVETAHSPFVEGVTDLSAPIRRGDFAVAALTIPFLKRLNPKVSADDAVAALKAAASRISDRLIGADLRP